MGVVVKESFINLMSGEDRDAGANLVEFWSVFSLLVVAGNFNRVVGW